MKTLTIRLPDALMTQIEVELRRRKLSKSDVVRERLTSVSPTSRRRAVMLDAIADLIGSVDGLPSDLGANKKKYLKATGYGRKPAR